MGLGREKELAKAVGDVWWKDSVGGTLARLQSLKKDKKKAAAKTLRTKSCSKPLVGLRRAEGKWKRTESGQELAELEKKAQASME